MRKRSVRPAADGDVERRALAAALVQQHLHPPGELPLGAADEPLAREPLVRLVGDLRGLPDRVELAVLLDRAQALDDSGAGNELRRTPAKDLVVRIRHDGRLEADAPAQHGCDVGVHEALRLDDLDVLHGSPGALGVAEVGEEPHALGLDEERDVVAVEAGQVLDVDLVGDEERLLEAGPEAL